MPTRRWTNSRPPGPARRRAPVRRRSRVGLGLLLVGWLICGVNPNAVVVADEPGPPYFESVPLLLPPTEEPWSPPTIESPQVLLMSSSGAAAPPPGLPLLASAPEIARPVDSLSPPQDANSLEIAAGDEEEWVEKFSPERLLAPLERFPITAYGFTVADSWRGLPDGHFQNNNGVKKGLNFGGLVPGLREYGIGAQLGASYGLYHTSGRDSDPDAAGKWQQQTFVTAGLFRHATVDLPLSFGIVYDGMINAEYGVFAQSPYLSQFRMQIGYIVNPKDEIGFWMTQHGPGTTHYPGGIATSWRAINQYNLFWQHQYQPFQADTRFWIGVPSSHRLDGDGSLGDLVLGSSASAPITTHMMLYGIAAFLMPSARTSAAGSTEDSFYVGFGMAFYGKRNARRFNVAGNPEEPYLPVADNSTFFVDTTRTN
jgi:hypothetical protein